ncbi:MAG: hypothetical protein PVJ27_10125 [Candidatus Brocadiaceae bacterium]|jgi:hypothetical protein
MSSAGPLAPHNRGATPAVKTGLAIAAILAVAAGLYLCVRFVKSRPGQAPEPAATTGTGPQALREVDPELIKYHEVDRIDTGFREPRGIALAPDRSLYVAGDDAIRVFDLAGEQRSEIPLGAPPYCLGVHDSGALYVGFRDHVEAYSPGRDSRTRWPSVGERAYLTSLALSGDDVWVADAGNAAILHYDTSGRLVGRIGEEDEAREIPGLVVPSPHLDVRAAPGGQLLVNTPGRWAVETYTAEGELQSSWSRGSQTIEGFCGCCNPTDIALLPDGKVVTSEKGVPRVKVYSPDGILESVVAAPADFKVNTAGLDLAIDGEGRVLVLDPPARAVRIFARRDPAGPQEAAP